MSGIIIAAGPVIVENGQVLLNKHGEDNFWKFCGGRVEPGETDAREAACREVKEEMGLEIKMLDEQPYLFYVEKMVDSRPTSVILIHFLAARSGEVLPGPDILEWRWVSLADLDGVDLAPNIKPALQHFGFIK